MAFSVYTTQPELDAPRANWFGVTPMMQARGEAYENLDFTPADVQFMAEIAGVPGKHHLKIGEWQGDFEAVMGAPMILDFEKWWDVRFRDKIIDYIETFRQIAPRVQLGVYPGGWLYDATRGWMNNDDLYLGRTSKVTRFLQGRDDFSPIADLLDFVCPSIYPLEKPAWKRDQFVNRWIVGVCRELGKPVLPFMFGGWRDFRGDRVEKLSKMNISELSQYAEIAREECDGAIVWGSKPGGGVWPGNQTLIDVLER
jgi:hypothetical protein